MTISPRAVEAAVKAIGALRKARRAALPFMPYGTSKPIMDKDLAETAITAYLAALAVDGLCLAPVEATAAMCEAARTEEELVKEQGFGGAEYGALYAAMLAAASTGDSTRKTEG